ncbi:SDR family NAD(P)-dependent oxidoreductase, partial [Streptomyces sp.]|uniref:SDR family NAD(P)-dependent oxidoreductase n=1 Tax=Streptomyces sp. TaxID=1931 RepID=UPI002F42803A
EAPSGRPSAPAAPARLDSLVADHLSLHDQYMSGQLDSVRQLTDLLTQAADQGRVGEIMPGVSAVKEHGLAIGRTHLRANEILRELAGLEYGAAPAAPSTTAPIAPAAFVRPQHAAIPPYTPAPPAALPAAPSAPVTPALELPPAPAALPPAPAALPPAPAAPAPAPLPAPAVAPAVAPASGGGASVDAAAVQAALLEVVSEKTGYPTDMLDLGMDIEADLGIDSIKRVEIMGSLQERFPTESTAGPEALAELRTLSDITAFISSQTSTAAAPAAPAATPAVAPASGGGAAVDPAAVQAALLEVVAEKTGYPTDMLDLGMDIEADLGIDSIKRVEIMGTLQERFPTATTAAGPEALAELRTLSDITAFISNQADTATVTGTTPGAPAAPDAAEDADGIGRGQAVLTPLPEPDRLVGAFPEGSVALLVDDGGDLVPPLARRLAAEGWQISVLRLPEVAARLTDEGVEQVDDNALSGWGSAELAARVKEITDRNPRLVLLPATRQDLDWREGVRRLAHGLLIAKHVVAPLREAAATGRTAFLTVTALDGAFGLRGVAEALAPAGGYGGLVKTLAVEAPEVFCRGVDLAPGLDPADAAALVTAELHDAAAGPVQVARDGAGRAALSLAETPFAERAGHEGTLPSEPTADDLLVVTGGGRGITASCVVDLAGRYHTGLLLLGRTPLTEEPGWAAGLYGPADLKAAAVGHLREQGEKPVPKRVEQMYQSVVAVREIRQTLEQVHTAGGTAEYLAVDITDAAAVKAALAPYAARVTGLVHGAGVLADQLIEQKKAAEIERVFAPKLDGLRAVVQALPEERLRHVLLFSSVAGFFGNRGQSDYAMANEVLNAWASSFKLRHPDSRVTSVNWGAWDSGMVSPQIKEVFAERGIALIGARTGPRLFTEQFAADRGGDVVTVLGPTTPLSSRPVVVPPTAVVVQRELSALADTALVTDHVIGDTPVVPAALALGWAIGAVERITGATVGRVRDFSVLKGVVLGADEHERLRLRAQAAADGSGAEVLIESADGEGATRPRYSAKLDLTAAGSDRPLVTGLPALGGGRDAAGLYQDGTLFHGPALRGIRKVAAEDGTRLVLECELAEPAASGGAFSGALYGPGTADLLLQAALVWTRLHRNTASLPLAVAEAELYEALPDGGPFLAVVEPVDPAADPNSAITKLTVTACAPDGRVLARFAGVSVAAAPQLAAKFVNS